MSTPKDYERFHEYLNKTFGGWEKYTTYQWSGTITTIVVDNKKVDISWHRSSWEAIFNTLTGHNLPHEILDSKFHACVDLDFNGSCDTNFDKEYTPKTGPYTGVGYFMEVIWG